MLAGWRSRRSGQMRQIRFDTRAVPAFFFCSSPTFPLCLSSLLSIVTFLFFFPFRIFLLGLVFPLPRGSSCAAGVSRTSYANANNNRTSIREKVNFRGYGCWFASPSSLVFFFFFAFFSKRRRSEESGANKRLCLYKLRETDDGAAARGRAPSSRHWQPEDGSFECNLKFVGPESARRAKMTSSWSSGFCVSKNRLASILSQCDNIMDLFHTKFIIWNDKFDSALLTSKLIIIFKIYHLISTLCNN